VRACSVLGFPLRADGKINLCGYNIFLKFAPGAQLNRQSIGFLTLHSQIEWSEIMALLAEKKGTDSGTGGLYAVSDAVT
jgi:hypothetical protein